MPRTIIRALSYALPRRYAEEDLAVIQGKWAIAFFVSVFLLCQATDAPCGTKVKGFLKYADSYQQKKNNADVLFDRKSFVLLSNTGNVLLESAALGLSNLQSVAWVTFLDVYYSIYLIM